MKNFKMTIAFDGSKYKGWQRPKDQDLTIQGKIAAVLSKMTGEDILLVGCEQTDSGVHAENYIANFHTKTALSAGKMLDYLYEFLPEDIVVKSIEKVVERFHAKYNVKSLTYVYRVNTHPFRDVFTRKYTYHLAGKLNLSEMRKAAEILIGSHDFQNFTNGRSSDKSTTRTIHFINMMDTEGLLTIEINANGFMWNMARALVGTLIEVGKGNLRLVEVEKLLSETKRQETAPLAQVKGLCLKDVQY